MQGRGRSLEATLFAADRAAESGVAFTLYRHAGKLSGRPLGKIGKSVGKSSDSPDTAQAQIAAMRTELKSTRQSMVLAMLQLQSASERLQAVTYSTQEAQPDPQVLGALLHTVRYDTSVDVRLAALDALGRYGSRPEVRKGLIESMQDQQSPMVQIALIDLLVDLHDRSAVQQLKKYKQDPGVNPAVKKRAEWGIQKLT